MGNILNDIVEEIDIKPNKTKLILKWIISIAGSLIVFAFVFGQFKSSFFNKMDKFEKTLNKSITTIDELKIEVNKGFEDVNARVDKVYIDGFKAFEEYQEFNKKQLILVLDYGQNNKKLLKEMLEVNILEKTRNVENQLMQAKNESAIVTNNREFSIVIKPMEQKKNDDYFSMINIIEIETNDTIFNVTAATMDFINKIDKNQYEVGTIVENTIHPKRYDFTYRNK